MLSGGVPMFVMGDEVRRTQRGNNNAYCQDNDTSWFDWTLPFRHADILRFVKLLIQRRLLRDVEHERRRATLLQILREEEHAWHGVRLNRPDWSRSSHTIVLGGELKEEGISVHIILNAYWESLEFELPVLKEGKENWRRWIDTALDPPNDICDWQEEQVVSGTTYRVGARSVVVLIAGRGRVPSISDEL
jgi:glycogen operon protein